MNLKFSKKIVTAELKKSEEVRLYNIFNGDGLLISEFTFTAIKQVLQINKRTLGMKLIEKPFKRPRAQVIDRDLETQVGDLEIIKNGINHNWEDVPSDPNAKIWLDGFEYYFRRISPDVNYSFSKQDTWDYFKFKLYSLKGDNYALYSFKMDIPVWSKPNYTNYRHFNGEIETNFENVLLLSLAFYLFEGEFYYEDHKNDG